MQSVARKNVVAEKQNNVNGTRELPDALGDQILSELDSAYLYLRMAKWLERQNWHGFANWMRTRAREEVGHAMVLHRFLHNNGPVGSLGKMSPGPSEFASLDDVMTQLFSRARAVAGGIQDLLHLSAVEAREDVRNLITWFVSVQLEEEASALDLYERVRSVGPDRIAELDASLSGDEYSAVELLLRLRRETRHLVG